MTFWPKVLRNKKIWALLALICLVYLNNVSWVADGTGQKPMLLAHRGLAQTFHTRGLTGMTNTARRIYPPEHPYLENTLPSMAAAFRYGADIVELDVQKTRDGRMAVFHDWFLEYRTNGKGEISKYTMAELKKLDVGYGYTADNGKTYPFRGKGVGMMPELDEVMRSFPEQSFLLHIKSNYPEDGQILARYLESWDQKQLRRVAVYGGDKPIATLHKQLPKVRVMSKQSLIKALLVYEAVGWTGYVPKAIRHTEIHLPVSYARWLWGWPNRFMQRMNRADTRVVLVEGSGEFSEGFDTALSLKKIPAGFGGVIWTNRIDRIGPFYKRGKR